PGTCWSSPPLLIWPAYPRVTGLRRKHRRPARPCWCRRYSQRVSARVRGPPVPRYGLRPVRHRLRVPTPYVGGTQRHQLEPSDPGWHTAPVSGSINEAVKGKAWTVSFYIGSIAVRRPCSIAKSAGSDLPCAINCVQL